MKTTFRFSDGILTVSLAGELDHHAAGECMRAIESKIMSALPRTVELDMRELRFMDSSGIAVVLKTLRLVNEISGRFAVVNVQEQPAKVLDASGMDRIVDIGLLPREV